MLQPEVELRGRITAWLETQRQQQSGGGGGRGGAMQTD
jgi:hypothetical protein